MNLMYKLAVLFGLACGLFLIGSRIFNFIKTREKAQFSGIIYTAFLPLQKPWILVIDVLLTIFLCYNVYVSFHNQGIYRHRVEFVEQYGVSDILEYKGISEDAISDMDTYTRNYIRTYQNKAERAGWGGVADIGFLLLIMSLNLWLVGGYVTTDGWYWIFSRSAPEVIHIKEEKEKLCFYLGKAASPVIKLPDTIENRERFALIMEHEEIVEDD